MTRHLVTGASGQLGQAVIRHLLETSGVAASNIVAVSRDISRLEGLKAKGIETREADFSAPEGLAGAFAGVDNVLIISTDAIGHRVAQHQAAINAAKQAGAARLFYTSMLEPATSKVIFAPEHQATEEAIRASGLAFTIFRNGWYMENLFAAMQGALPIGRWYSSAAEGRTSYIARDDIARAIAAGLAAPESDNAIYSLTGQEALTNQDIAALISRITGKPLSQFTVSDEQLAEGLKAVGLPAEVVPLLVSFDTATRAGDLSAISGDVERLTGTKPQTLEAFLEAHKERLGR
ncbi:SDR family oxidoreductase [Allorhizobium undicola]|uniref:SDR family oxidoreductase n=1 Tax=Allorhizobium undicola TaxID=78527 RepID=UPI003D34EAEB